MVALELGAKLLRLRFIGSGPPDAQVYLLGGLLIGDRRQWLRVSPEQQEGQRCRKDGAVTDDLVDRVGIEGGATGVAHLLSHALGSRVRHDPFTPLSRSNW